MTRDVKLEASLLIMRVTVAAFMFVWAIDKVIAPEHAQAVFSRFYFADLSPAVLKSIGFVQVAVIVAFAVGFARFWTYGAILLMHAGLDGLNLCSTLEPLGR
jgi:hypothetical protein